MQKPEIAKGMFYETPTWPLFYPKPNCTWPPICRKKRGRNTKRKTSRQLSKAFQEWKDRIIHERNVLKVSYKRNYRNKLSFQRVDVQHPTFLDVLFSFEDLWWICGSWLDGLVWATYRFNFWWSSRDLWWFLFWQGFGMKKHDRRSALDAFPIELLWDLARKAMLSRHQLTTITKDHYQRVTVWGE